MKEAIGIAGAFSDMKLVTALLTLGKRREAKTLDLQPKILEPSCVKRMAMFVMENVKNYEEKWFGSPDKKPLRKIQLLYTLLVFLKSTREKNSAD